jgi:5-methylcytosine-specific restriction endonuclease McrA
MVDSELDLVFNLHCLQKRSARKRFRRSIFDEWPECAYCGRSKPSTLDHVVPKARGGKTTKENLIAACGDCNILKSSEDWYCWFRSQDFWTPEREDRILNWVNQSDADPFSLVPVSWDYVPLAA